MVARSPAPLAWESWGDIGTPCVAPGVVSVVHQRRRPGRMRVVPVCCEVGRALVAPLP